MRGEKSGACLTRCAENGVAGSAGDLDSADDAPDVGGGDVLSGIGVDGAQALVQGLSPLLTRYVLQLLTHHRVRRHGGNLPAFREAPHVLSRASDDHRRRAARRCVEDGLSRSREEVDEAESLVRFGYVYEVVRCGGELGGCGLRRADGHAAIDLPAVRVDDLNGGINGDAERRRRLAARGRAYDEEDRRACHARRWQRP